MSHHPASSQPGTWRAVLDELHPNDPAYPDGLSLASLYAMLGGNERGTLQIPDLPVVALSLEAWHDRDPQTTHFRLGFVFTPDGPIASGTSNHPQPPPAQHSMFLVMHDPASGHRVELRPVSRTHPPTTIGAIRHHPDLAQTVVSCPLCDATVQLMVPLAELVQRLGADLDGDATPIDICMYHPTGIPETKTPSLQGVIRATRTWSTLTRRRTPRAARPARCERVCSEKCPSVGPAADVCGWAAIAVTTLPKGGDSMTEVKGFQSGTAAIAGAGLYYEIAGAGPPLVLVHAGFVDRRMWDEQFPVFAQHYRVVRYDRRGFGNSTLTPGPFSHRRDLYQLLQFLGIERAHLLGCSMGGEIIIDFALEHPEMTTALVLVSSALGGYQFQGDMPKPLQELIAALQAQDLNQAAELAVRLWIDGPRRTPDQVDARIRERGRAMSRTALPNAFVEEEPLAPSAVERLREVTAPTLVIVGELDDPSIATIGDVLTTRIVGAQKVSMFGVAHLPNMEQPAEFNQRVLAFLHQVSM